MFRSDLAGAPAAPRVVPAALRPLIGDRPAEAVWRNALGGITFRVGNGGATQFVKWHPSGSEDPGALDREARRLRWAAPYVAVPRVRAAGSAPDGSWLITAALLAAGEPASNAVDPRWIAQPGPAVRAIGAGLRRLHDELPAADCPFDWSAPGRIEVARRRAADGLQKPARWNPEHRGLSVEEALARLAEPPPVDRLVVCHGDACAPNTVLDDAGGFVGVVDLGSLGTADRWADLAIATWSTLWNYGPGWEDPLLEAYGVARDPARIAYYRLLWDLS